MMPKRSVDGVPVSTPQCPLTQLPWGSSAAVSRLKGMLSTAEAQWQAYEGAPVGQTYESGDAKLALMKLGLVYEAIRLHLQIQASRLKDTGPTTVLARG